MDWLHFLLLTSTVLLGALAVVAAGKVRDLERERNDARRGEHAARREFLSLSQEMERQVRVLEELTRRAAHMAGPYRGS